MSALEAEWWPPLVLGLLLTESRADDEAERLVGQALLQLETVPPGQWTGHVLRSAVSVALWARRSRWRPGHRGARVAAGARRATSWPWWPGPPRPAWRRPRPPRTTGARPATPGSSCAPAPSPARVLPEAAAHIERSVDRAEPGRPAGGRAAPGDGTSARRARARSRRPGDVGPPGDGLGRAPDALPRRPRPAGGRRWPSWAPRARTIAKLARQAAREPLSTGLSHRASICRRCRSCARSWTWPRAPAWPCPSSWTRT